MEHLETVVQNAEEWLSKGNVDIIIDDTVPVHVRTACITKEVVKAPGPSFYVGPHVILFIPSESTEPSHIFPIVAHKPLQQRLLTTCVDEYPTVMKKQSVARQEITGIVACKTADVTEVGLFFCATLKNSTFSSEPHCGARRMCRRAELLPGWTLLGEFHSHPVSTTYHNRKIMAPPSDADLFQSLVATMKGEHNRSYVFAPEGIYCFVISTQARTLFEHDLELFFDAVYPTGKNEYTAAVAECKQPIAKLVNPELKYLHCLLHKPKHWFRSICRAKMSVLEMANAYMALIDAHLHIDIHLHPRED